MKKPLVIVAVAAAIIIGYARFNESFQIATPTSTRTIRASSDVQTSFSEQQSGQQVTGVGVVSKILSDDIDGSRHQKFLLKLSSGQTILMAHNIDIAPRISNLKSGDTVSFSGIYESNSKGGVVHWTHRDPSGRHEAGWLKHSGKTYQ